MRRSPSNCANSITFAEHKFRCNKNAVTYMLCHSLLSSFLCSMHLHRLAVCLSLTSSGRYLSACKTLPGSCTCRLGVPRTLNSRRSNIGLVTTVTMGASSLVGSLPSVPGGYFVGCSQVSMGRWSFVQNTQGDRQLTQRSDA